MDTGPTAASNSADWQFWADQGGTFTDLIGRAPDGRLHSTKVLSQAAQGQADAVARGMAQLLATAHQSPKAAALSEVRIGTTLGTNALLERQTARTALLVTAGFADLLRIGYQQRPDLFALNIQRPPPVCEQVLEIRERLTAEGAVLCELDEEAARHGLQQLAATGVEAVAICLLHAWRNPQHELRLKQLATAAGIGQVSVSHEVLPQIRMVGRGDTTAADAALAPIISREFEPLRAQLGEAKVSLYFMQSNGYLAEAGRFRGCDSVLSGPAGGVTGGIAVARKHGLQSVIGFDMGGTSTDVWHFSGELERRRETEIGGCRILTPTLDVHTIAAGGGSILRHHLGRLRVGPASAGAMPGPACYGRGGPAAVTDANFVTGRLLPEFFPALFGPHGDARPDPEAAERALALLGQQVLGKKAASTQAVRELGDAFLSVACDQMARAIGRISMERGYDPSDSTLLCLGGAAGQHVCRVAERLEMTRILAHPMSGVLSALGVGMGQRGGVRRRTLNLDLAADTAADQLREQARQLRRELLQELRLQGLAEAELDVSCAVALLYAGADVPLELPLDEGSIDVRKLAQSFANEHHRRYGYRQSGSPVLVESLVLQAHDRPHLGLPDEAPTVAVAAGKSGTHRALPPSTSILTEGGPVQAAIIGAAELTEDWIDEPALVVHPQFTLAVEPGWRARALQDSSLLLERQGSSTGKGKGKDKGRQKSLRPGLQPGSTASAQSRAACLELFIGLFRNIAEEMGTTLRKTAASVNIRERLDYSCALFSGSGELIANAPHIPVHIGSMAESVRALIADGEAGLLPHSAGTGQQWRGGDFYACNDPGRGGTHLPDITVITPVVAPDAGSDAGSGRAPAQFFLAVRGHHAEIGGIEPGSMPSDSTSLQQEGVLFRNQLIASDGQLLHDDIRALLTAGPWPSRDPDLNLRDLQAQVAACRTGGEALARVLDRYGIAVAQHWAGQVLASGEEAVQTLVQQLQPGRAQGQLQNGTQIAVSISPEPESGQLLVDFTGTGAACADNFNAPAAVTRAAVLYVLRCLISDDIPLNEGCMRPVELRIPKGSVLAAEHPAAVVAGNVETSQAVCNLLLSALGVQAGSQGTMNNLTFGNDHFQYYETLAGGTGAGRGWPGADAVHSHMTNSRLTDPEVLETRLPVRIESLAVRPQSGGAGRWPGGSGMVRQIRFLSEVSCSLITSTRTQGAAGMAGGGAGMPGRNLRLAADGTETQLPACTTLRFAAGEALRLETPGGGGYGTPEQ